jgi:hypothetical protein
MSAKFLHISFNFEGRAAPYGAIEKTINTATDWVRYTPNCYILYTTASVQKWYERLRKNLHEDDSIFIVEIVISNRQGWMPKYVWTWINKDRNDAPSA